MCIAGLLRPTTHWCPGGLALFSWWSPHGLLPVPWFSGDPLVVVVVVVVTVIFLVGVVVFVFVRCGGHGRRRALSLCVGLRWHGLTTCISTAAKTSLQVARNLVELRGGIPWVS